MKKQYIIPLMEIENADMTEIIATSLSLHKSATEEEIESSDEILAPSYGDFWDE